MAAVAVSAAIMTAGTAATAFAAEGAHAGHAVRASHAVRARSAVTVSHAAQVKLAEASTINKFVWGRYLIIVRYVKDDPLPKRFDMPMTLKAGAEENATSGQLTTLQRSYESLARGSIQVFMLKPAEQKAVKHVQRHRVHAHVNTGFGGLARLVAHHFPYAPHSARR
jgi:hypothetical protein